MIPAGLYAQTDGTNTVRGTVVDNAGPLPGVTVLVQGTTNVTTTDADGNYTITVAGEGAVLVFSYIGYKSIAYPVGSRSRIDVTMEEEISRLDEVVVIGYGAVKKSDVTGAIASVNDATIKEVPASNFSQALQGRVAGMDIQQTSTRPGSDAQIRIRGTRSLTASNDPLIIVDGIPFAGSLNDIPPGDIKSVDILKDASSTAIYGSRGATGVIIITTTRATVYTKPQINYNGYFGISTVAQKYKMMDAEKFIQMRTLSGYESANPWLPQEQQYFTTGQSFDWQDEMYQTAFVNSHDLSFRGGSEVLQGSLGMNYYNESSVLPGQKFTRYSLRGSLDFTLKKWLKVGFSTQEAFSLPEGEGVSIVALYGMLAFNPLVNPYDADGKVIPQPLYPREDTFSPLLLKDEDTWAQERKRFNTLNSLYAEVQFTPAFKYRANFGFNYSHDQYGEYYGTNTPFRGDQVSQARISLYTAYNYTLENLLYYDKVFAGKHRLGITLMQSIEDYYSEYKTATGLDMTADYMKYFNLGMANESVTFDGNQQSYSRRVLLSFMGRFSYSYDDRYVAMVTFRSDGASVLSEGKKWHTYPAISLAWNLQNESFLKGVETLDMLKIRGGYGQTSNQSIQPYATFGSLGQSRYNFGSAQVYGYFTNTLNNPNLGWEYTDSYNIGIDFSLWRRLSGSIDFYLQNTHDLLVGQRLPSSTGVAGSIMVNVGRTQNKGMEISLRSDNIVAETPGDFSWVTDFTFYVNRNKLLELNSGVEQDEANGWFVGYPIDVIFDYEKIGIWQSNEAAEAAAYGFKPGQIKFNDYTPDGVFSANDRHVIHTFEPDAIFSITNRFAFKNFDLSIVAYSQIGGTLVSSLHQGQSYLNTLNGRRNNIDIDYWRTDNPTNENPAPYDSGGAQPTYYSSLGYFDASYLQIQTVTLGYTLPKRLMQKAGIDNLRCYVTCNNVATLFSPYMDKGGVSPRPTGFGAQGVGGVGSPQMSRQLTVTLSTPPTRQFLFGVSLTL
jgi:TonB-linked SusC/RagA family outer membrane protein